MSAGFAIALLDQANRLSKLFNRFLGKEPHFMAGAVYDVHLPLPPYELAGQKFQTREDWLSKAEKIGRSMGIGDDDIHVSKTHNTSGNHNGYRISFRDPLLQHNSFMQAINSKPSGKKEKLVP